MTEEELRRLMMRQAAGGSQSAPQMSPDFQNQSAVTPAMLQHANKDYRGREAQLAQQMRQGYDMAFGGQGPRGVQAGNIYVGPTWSSSLADAVRKGIGGYYMGQAREGQEELNAERNLSTEAQNAIANMQYREQQRQQATENARADERLGLERAAGARADERMAADAAQRAQQNARAWATVRPEEYVNVENGDDTITAVMSPEGVLLNTQTGEPVDQEKYRKAGPVRGGSRGGYTSDSIKNVTRWTNGAGDVVTTYDSGGKTYDYDSREPMKPGWIKDGGFYEESAVSGAGRNSALAKLNKDTENLRSLATDYGAMITTMEKYGIDLMSGDDPLGRFEKAEGAVGNLTRMIEDAARPGAETGEIYSSIRAVLNSVIRNQAGMSQTVAEIEKLNQQYGSTWQADPAIMAEALRRLGPKIKGDIGARVAALDSDTLSRYRQGLESGGVPDWTQWTPSGEPEEDGPGLARSRRAGRGQGARNSETDIDAEIRRLEEELGL